MRSAPLLSPPPRPRQRPETPLLTIIVPVFNEDEAITVFLDRLGPHLGPLGVRNEIIFVNDGSTDGTLAQLLALTRTRDDVTLVNLSRNFGKEAAMTAGLDHANGDAIVVIDVDLQDPPELIERFVSLWRDGYDVVYGLRGSRNEEGRLKTSTAGFFYRFFNKLSDTAIPPNVGDFRLLDKRVVAALRRLPERGRFMKGLFAWVGFAAIAVPYDRPARAVGQSKWNYWRLWNFAIEGIVSFSSAPLKIWTYIGLGVALSALLYAAFIVVRVLSFGIEVPGYASLIIVLLFSTSMNLISLGVIGEYISRLFVEVKQRPIYLVEGIYSNDRVEKSSE